jgi:xanthosine utilization system XapX-like protein
MDLVRGSWLELWRRNRGGGILTLAFWYTLVTTLYWYLVAVRLRPELPQSFLRMVAHPSAAAVMPHFSATLLTKLGLFYLTFLVVILPFSVGGLYGGVASAIRETPEYTSFLAFFRYGYLNFWRALTQVVLGLVYAALVIGVLVGIFLALSAVAAGGPIPGIVAVIVGAVGILWLVGTALYWFGQTFASQVAPARGWLTSVRWGLDHAGRLMSSTILLVGLLIAGFYVTSLMAAFIPVLGEVLLVLVVGMVIPAYLATYAVLLYQQFPPS